ncbi:uncharacterized protein Tgi isoform X2 [Drosophila takahashii]|uniref:uncharacterized protein Tgi isoform X2 n=1 Tax=Drosophila takahashii TaxID=29030 RepID=UPI0038995235
MESALDVLSRAATMVQNNPSEMRVTSKELPTTKWRRDRRQRTAEYQVHEVQGAGSSEREREREREHEDRDMDSPIDMSVTTGALKQRASPPPPYREPLPGTNYAANSRPSVITQAPPKREPPEQAHQSSDMAMCDIDEHFRRSLGENYAALFAKKSPTPTPTPTPSPGGTPKQQVSPLAYGPPAAATAPLSSSGSSSSSSSSYHLAKPGLVIPMEPELEHSELPPPQEEPLPLSLALHRTQTPPSPPPSATLPIPITMPMEAAVAAKRMLDTPPRYNTPPPPPPAYGTAGNSVTPTPTLTPSTPNPNPTGNPNPTPSQIPTPTPSMPAIIRVKAEPGLATAAAAASSTQTPPASPTSSTNISIFTKTEASVDDHFAKALGDTWKKLQGGSGGNKE